jgi:hypothetical protein
MSFVEAYAYLPFLFCSAYTARSATVGTQMWSSERRVAVVRFVQSYVSLDKKYTEENLNLFALQYTSFIPDLLKFVFLEGDKFQIYVILRAPRPSRITLARVSGEVGGGKTSVSCLALFDLSLVFLLAKMKREEH